MARREVPIAVIITPGPAAISPFNPLNQLNPFNNPFNPYGFPTTAVGATPYTPGYVPNALGNMTQTLTAPSAGTGASQSGIAQIISINPPPATAVGTSFPLSVSFQNLSGSPLAFQLVLTASQLGLDQVATPPVTVNGGQQGVITQNMQMPTLNTPSVAGYTVSIQLVHADANGSQIVDDQRTFTLPAPTAAVLSPGGAINTATGQVTAPGGVLPTSPVPQAPVAVSTPIGTVPVPAPVLGAVSTGTNATSIPPLQGHVVNAGGVQIAAKPLQTLPIGPISSISSVTNLGNLEKNLLSSFNMPAFRGFAAYDYDGDGIQEGSCMEHTRHAFMDCDSTQHGFNVKGYNFCPHENVGIHHHMVMHGHDAVEGNVLEDDQTVRADHTGRFIISLPIPEFLIGFFGDGLISARGHRSKKKATTTSTFR